MMNFINLTMAFLCASFVPLCASPEVGSKGEQSRLDTLSPSLIQLGFTVKKHPAADSVSPWEKENFGILRKRTMAMISRFSSNLGRTSFYRFWIDEEYFGTENDARQRLDSLCQMPPYFKGQREKDFPLRNGFRSGDKVFIFRTDVSAYSRKLEQLTKGVELLETVSGNSSRRKTFDSLKTEIQKPY